MSTKSTTSHDAKIAAAAAALKAAPPDVLTLEQNAALRVLLAGGGVIAAAEAGKVHRGTLYRWMQKDKPFRRALESEQDRARWAARRQMITLVEDAASNVRNAIRCGEVNVSLSVLRGLGLLSKIESCESVVSAEEAEAEAKPEY